MDSHKAAKAVKPKRNMSLGLVSLLFLAPALVFYIAFELWPIIQTIWYSFYEWNGIDASTFIGVENYITVFTDPDLYGSILHSFYLIIFFSIIPIVLGLIIAVLIKDMKSKVGRSFAQVCLFLPRVIPGAAAGVAWTWMLADKGTATRVGRHRGHLSQPDHRPGALLRQIPLPDARRRPRRRAPTVRGLGQARGPQAHGPIP